MLMNGRAIRKRLMRNRWTAWPFIGNRASLTLRLPASVIPEPWPERYSPPGFTELSEGCWTKPTANGTDAIYIDRFAHLLEPPEPSEFVFNIEQNSSGRYSFWDARMLIADGSHDVIDEPHVPLPEEDVQKYIAWRTWTEQYFRPNMLAIKQLPEALQIAHRAQRNAKTMHWSVSTDNQFVFVEYSVKVRHVRWALDFCSDMKQALRQLDALGIDARILK